MATFYGTNSTIANAPTPATILKPGLLGGNVRIVTDTYTVPNPATALVAGSLIHMGYTLPVGAKILFMILHTTALGTGVTLNVGDAKDDDRYISAVDCSGAITVFGPEAAEIDGRSYELDASDSDALDTQIIVDVHAADSTLTADAEIILQVYYTVE